MTRIPITLKTYLRSRRPVVHPTGKLFFVVVLATCSVALAMAVRAYTRKATHPVGISKASTQLRSPKDGKEQPSLLHARLALQPEADRFRRRLGERFMKPGFERTTMLGTLTLGAQQLSVRIVRTQDDDGEQVEIALGDGPASLTWNRMDGAQSASKGATGSERSLIERLVLDSPDQFVLAQRRGASYYTVAQQAMPEGMASDDYNGPVWDIVRIAERTSSPDASPESLYRLYYINAATGLIEKVFSNEQGQSVVAEISGWTQVGGESVPARTVWKINKQVAMELNLTSVEYGPRQ